VLGISPAGSDARNPAQLHPLKRVQNDKGACIIVGEMKLHYNRLIVLNE